MFNRVFEGVNFSYFYEGETEQYLLYWRKYDIDIRLNDDDALLGVSLYGLIPRRSAAAVIKSILGQYGNMGMRS